MIEDYQQTQFDDAQETLLERLSANMLEQIKYRMSNFIETFKESLDELKSKLVILSPTSATAVPITIPTTPTKTKEPIPKFTQLSFAIVNGNAVLRY